MDAERFSIAELAERAGVSRRTVRFYVQRGLLPPPHGRGRGEHYDASHLATLNRIKALQLAGASLEEIRARFAGAAAATSGERPFSAAPPTKLQNSSEPNPGQLGSEQWYVRQPVLPGVELHLSAGHSPLGERQLAMLAAFLDELLRKGETS